MAPKTVALPPLNFQFIPMNCTNAIPTKEEELTDESSNSKVKYPRRASLDVLANIIGQYAAYADTKK